MVLTVRMVQETEISCFAEGGTSNIYKPVIRFFVITSCTFMNLTLIIFEDFCVC